MTRITDVQKQTTALLAGCATVQKAIDHQRPVLKALQETIATLTARCAALEHTFKGAPRQTYYLVEKTLGGEGGGQGAGALTPNLAELADNAHATPAERQTLAELLLRDRMRHGPPR